MSETKQAAFTPGPWRVVGFSTLGGSIRKKHYGFAVTDNFGSKFAELTIEPLFSLEVQQANSRLIAASPAMYEALQVVVNLCDDGDADSLTRQAARAARAALRAAEGKPE